MKNLSFYQLSQPKKRGTVPHPMPMLEHFRRVPVRFAHGPSITPEIKARVIASLGFSVPSLQRYFEKNITTKSIG